MMPDMRDQTIPGAKPSPGAWSSAGEEPKMPLPKHDVRVWDLPTRLFHWAIVVLLVALYVTWRMNWMGWHVLGGEALLALVLFRVLWGFFGAETARFARFAASPRKALRHLAEFPHREPDTRVGHNPAGAWMVFALLGLLLAEVLTGLYINNDVANEGPFTEIAPASVANVITDLHAILWEVILGAVALHIFAIVAYAALKDQNLVGPMLTGKKRLPETIIAPRQASLWLALLLLALAAGAAVIISYAI